jgi:hypothetical protein
MNVSISNLIFAPDREPSFTAKVWQILTLA